jgi:hypothetical protein
MLDFWDDLSADGQLENRTDDVSNKPLASLAVSDVLPAHAKKTIRFLITWYFPNRTAWSSKPLKNYYAIKYNGAWDVATRKDVVSGPAPMSGIMKQQLPCYLEILPVPCARSNSVPLPQRQD